MQNSLINGSLQFSWSLKRSNRFKSLCGGTMQGAPLEVHISSSSRGSAVTSGRGSLVSGPGSAC